MGPSGFTSSRAIFLFVFRMKIFSLFYFIFYFGHAALGITPTSIVFNFLYFFSFGIEFLTTPPLEGIGPSGFTLRRWIRAMEMIWKHPRFMHIIINCLQVTFSKVQRTIVLSWSWDLYFYRFKWMSYHGTCIFRGFEEFFRVKMIQFCASGN